MRNTLEYSNAEDFGLPGRIYEFPFIVRTKELGRIEWCIELERSKKKRNGLYYISALLVWAKQTLDERYKEKIFQIPCYSEMLHNQPHGEDPSNFIHHIWSIGFCEIHKNIYFKAYPENHHTRLRVKPNSSVVIEANFL